MAFTSGNVSILTIDGTDVSAYFEQATIERTRKELELPRLGSNGIAMLAGPRKVTIKADYWYDPAVVAILDPLMDADPQPTCTLSYQADPINGGPTHTITAYCSSLDSESNASNPNKGKVQFVSVDGVVG
jgi:hypothetical protein